MAYVVVVIEEDGVSVFIPFGAAEVSQLADMDPPGPPLTHVVLDLR
jgi:hypothetical protein